MNNGKNGHNVNGNDAFLAAQQKRIDAARQKMAARQEWLRQRRAKDNERLFRTVGEACCKGAQRPGFAAPLKEVLETETDEQARAFLRQKGML